MSGERSNRAIRTGLVAALLAVSAVPIVAGRALGEESLSELKERMAGIQQELDATTARIEKLRDEQEEVRHRIADIEERMAVLEARGDRLQKTAEQRAEALYRSGGTGMVEALFGANDLGELSARVEMLSRASQEDNGVFVELARNDAELTRLTAELTERRSDLADSEEQLTAATERLREQFASVQDEYEELKAELARLAALRERRREARQEAAVEAAAPDPAPAPAPAPQPVVHATGGMACPVAGPNSFVDSWGAPRAGHTHQGVDMMADYGTPVVAIVSGTIIYAAYNGSGGNMIFLRGDNGNQYWYMHNQRNIVTSGHVSVGQQIATVGDTGNASGIPHLHFEYHPGGGGAVNPYPLVSSIC